ncbi:unnamed protein product [Cuscuta epithymum]|uniref:Uncharacterized protein n=1 Tax=Cuscuta epithymum TaxID=186058 RepID=A0AAV0CI85_9ASTE|nr:unnamed protein product [Cuscuta epithymum]CAH9131800.1 unnamed protein product [Cuscuta epithymum]
MQTSKARTTVDVPQRSSPTTPKTSRKVRTINADSESVSSPNQSSRTPKERSPRVVDRRSPRSPAIEVVKAVYAYMCDSVTFIVQFLEDAAMLNFHLSYKF